MQKIIIDEEFRSLLPTLDKNTYESFEADLIQSGCRDAIVLWGGILIEGHYRYEICIKHDIAFGTVDREFDSREEVLIWIISNQVSRRNLTPIQLSHYRGVHYRAEKIIVTNKNGKNQYSEVVRHNDEQPKKQSTVERLSEKYRVSPKTIERDAKASKAIDAIGGASFEARRKLLSSEVQIDKKALEGMSSWPKEEIEAVAAKIEEGTYEKKKTSAPSPVTAGGSAGPIPSGLRQWDTAVGKLTDGYSSELRKLGANSGKAKFKATLRSYIDALEGLYGSI